MADVNRLTALGMAPELAAELASQITAAVPTDAEIATAIAEKTEIAALTGASTAADIVTALQA